MTARQSTLALPPPTAAEAARIRDREMALAWEAADEEWLRAARDEILALPRGREFITEQIVFLLDERGLTTTKKRAIGTLVRELARKDYIRATGVMRPALTSRLGLKPVWKRTGRGAK